MTNELMKWKCWICGALADSSEHSHKQTDVRQVFGSGPYKKGKRLIRTNQDGKKNIIQSENSKFLKYKKNLCKYCNNERTQPYDEAYTQFISFINDNAIEILNNRNVSLKNIYHNKAKQQANYLHKYFIKNFGCKLVDSGQTVPNELETSVKNNKQDTPNSLLLTFSIYDDYPNKKDGFKGLMMSHNLCLDTDIQTGDTKISFAQSIGWLTVSYWYNHTINNNLGEPWCGKRKFIQLGHFSG